MSTYTAPQEPRVHLRTKTAPHVPIFVTRIIPILLSIHTLVYLLLPFRSQAYPEMFEDDFFYYALAARHILAGQGSTFDGIHRTNGYHPLWMLVVLAVTAIFHAGRPFYIAFCILIATAVLVTYKVLVAVLRSYTGTLTAQGLAAFVAVNFLALDGGMEITLTVPLLCVLVWFRLKRYDWSPGSALLLGLLSAAIVLSRLDSILFITSYAVLDLFLTDDKPWRTKSRAILPFISGMLPVVGYLGWNYLRYHSALPISAHAKELRSHGGFAALPFHSLLGFSAPLINTLIRPTLAAIALAALVVAFLGRGMLPSAHRGLVYALGLFMPIHILALSLTSDWRIWKWYLYPLLMSSLGAAVILLTRGERFFQRRYFMSGFFAMMLFAYAALHVMTADYKDFSNKDNPLAAFYRSGVDFAAFSRTHPGLYAMGDRAGLVGYMLPFPLIQTEGLMMDSEYLENVRQQRALLPVLKKYGVRYFIATNPVPDGSCALVREPLQGGPSALSMRGRFCASPIHAFTSDKNYTSYIFDLQNE